MYQTQLNKEFTISQIHHRNLLNVLLQTSENVLLQTSEKQGISWAGRLVGCRYEQAVGPTDPSQPHLWNMLHSLHLRDPPCSAVLTEVLITTSFGINKWSQLALQLFWLKSIRMMEDLLHLTFTKRGGQWEDLIYLNKNPPNLGASPDDSESSSASNLTDFLF